MAGKCTVYFGNITHCECSAGSGYRTFAMLTKYTMTITMDVYFEPYETPALIYYHRLNDFDIVDATEEFTKVDDRKWTLTTTFNPLGDLSTETAKLKCTGIEKYAVVNVNQTDCTVNIASGNYPAQEFTVIVRCQPNYEFQVEPAIAWEGHYEEDSAFLDKLDDTTYQKTFYIRTGFTYTIVAEAMKKSIVIDKYGTITAYRLTKDELKIVSTTRWQKHKYEPVTTGNITLYMVQDEYIDTAKYVTALIKIYAHLQSDSQARLRFGPYDMGIDCDVLGTDVFVLDCGSVFIRGMYGNSIDYDKTDMEAFLPFIGFVKLHTADYMDKDVSLYYRVNVLNGDALAVLTADGKIMLTHPCNVSFSVPFQLGGNEYISNNLAPNTNYLLDAGPFIYVKTHPAVNPDSDLPYHDTKFYSRLGDLTGYTEATEIDFDTLSDHITKTEIDEIKSLLGSGVFL